MRLIIIYFISLALYCPLAYNQADTLRVSASVQHLVDLWKSLPSPQLHKKPQGQISDAEKLFGYTGVNSLVQKNYNPAGYNAAQAAYLRKNYGLEVSAGYVENFNTAINAEDNMIYVRRLQAGINWNVLKSGFLENRYQAKSLEIENELLQLFPYESIHDVTFTERWNLTLYLFNLHKVSILRQREEVVKKLLQEEQALFHQKYLSYEHLLLCETRYAEILSLKSIYDNFNQRLQQAYALGEDTLLQWQLPLLEADYLAVTQGTLPAYIDTANRMILEKLKYQFAPLNEISLSPYLRYNYYDISNQNSDNRSFVSAGFNVSVPLSFRQKEKEEWMRMEYEKTRERLIFREENGSKELLTDYYEYEYKLKQYVSFHQKRLRFIELFRQETAHYQLDPVNFNPVKALELYDDILSIESEMLDLQQNLYLKLLRISHRKGNSQVGNYCRTLALPEHLENYFREEKSVYLWSRSYTEGNTDYLAEYIRFQQFGRVALSMGSTAETRTMALKTAHALHKMNIDCELLIGNNQLTPENIIETVNKALYGCDSLFTAIHLDFEPHTLSDWDARKTVYLAQFEKMLAVLQPYCQNKHLELRVSLPLHYPAEVVKSFLSYCNGIVFMAYENVKMNYLMNKLSVYENEADKIFVALRTEDFTSRTELESFIQDMGAATGFNRFYIHDVARCMQWDESTIGGGKP